ncbi:MAG TPA: hypothetical protein VJR92_13120 [Gemmatimonadaceae bacterium]|nr:hypothetical protein [Gemmatimonadaceae bacterium]
MRRLRGLAGITVTWAIVFVPLGVLVQIAYDIVEGKAFSASIGTLARGMSVMGAITGLTFGALLMTVERRRTFATLSFPRVIGWGVAASLVVPAIGLALGGAKSPLSAAIAAAMFALLGAVTAAATFALARRAGSAALNDRGVPASLNERSPMSAADAHSRQESR